MNIRIQCLCVGGVDCVGGVGGVDCVGGVDSAHPSKSAGFWQAAPGWRKR